MLEAISSLIIAATLLLGSPGPVPIALAGIGGVFGVGRGLPFLFGILAGLAVAISVGSAGVAALFAAVPESRIVLGVLGGLYIAYIAIKIASAPVGPGDLGDLGVEAAPPSFRDGFVLNLLNPKAYAAFLALFSQFLLPFSTSLASTLVTAVVILFVAFVVDAIWLMLGGLLAPVFQSARYGRLLRILMGVMMVLAVAYGFFSTQ